MILAKKIGEDRTEGKSKIKETADKKSIEQKESIKQLRKLETDLIRSKYKDNFKEYIEQRLFDFKYDLAHIDDETKLTAPQIDRLIRSKNLLGNPLYSAEELAILFEYYRLFVSEISQKTKYIPTKKNFCAFAGMSSTTYDNYLTDGDQAKIEVMKMIDDYITDMALTMAQNKEIDNVTTIYRSKAEHGMVEATAPIVFKHETDVNIDDIKETIKILKSGKSLKTIELSNDDYKVENEN